MRTFIHISILVAVAGFLYLSGLGEVPLTDPDETFYAQTADEMHQVDDWVTPRIFDEPQFEKPIFYYWLIRISYNIFGVNEFAARFPSVIFAVLGLIGVYLLGRLIFSPLCGLLSALVMTTSVEYMILARACVTDMVLTVSILFCLLFFILGQTSGRKRHYLAAAVMAAVAVLTKGPIGLFLPGMVILVYLSAGMRWKKIGQIPLFSSIFLFLVVCLPWYLLVYRLHGETFLNAFFGFQNITRFLVPEHRIGDTPFFYIPVVIGGLFPWSTFLIFGAITFFKERITSPGVKGYKLFLAAWFLVVMLFFSASRTKLVTYIFPLFPVLAIVTGRFWENFIIRAKEKKERTALFATIAYYLFFFLSLVSVAVLYFAIGKKYPQLADPILYSGIVFAVVLAISCLLFVRDNRKLVFLAIVGTVILTMIPVNRFVMPPVAVYESSEILSSKFNEVAGANDPLGAECDHRRGVAFYTDRTKIVDIHPFDALMKFFSREERVWGIIQTKHYNQLWEARDDVSAEIVERSGKYVLITNKPYKDRLES